MKNMPGYDGRNTVRRTLKNVCKICVAWFHVGHEIIEWKERKVGSNAWLTVSSKAAYDSRALIGGLASICYGSSQSRGGALWSRRARVGRVGVTGTPASSWYKKLRSSDGQNVGERRPVQSSTTGTGKGEPQLSPRALGCLFYAFNTLTVPLHINP
jgi:hypothetical protein